MAVLQKPVKSSWGCETWNCKVLQINCISKYCKVLWSVQCMYNNHIVQVWHWSVLVWIVTGQMYNLNRGGWWLWLVVRYTVYTVTVRLVAGSIEISLENYSHSRFLELPPLSAQPDKGLKLWFPAMEQKIFWFQRSPPILALLNVKTQRLDPEVNNLETCPLLWQLQIFTQSTKINRTQLIQLESVEYPNLLDTICLCLTSTVALLVGFQNPDVSCNY